MIDLDLAAQAVVNGADPHAQILACYRLGWAHGNAAAYAWPTPASTTRERERAEFEAMWAIQRTDPREYRLLVQLRMTDRAAFTAAIRDHLERLGKR